VQLFPWCCWGSICWSSCSHGVVLPEGPMINLFCNYNMKFSLNLVWLCTRGSPFHWWDSSRVPWVSRLGFMVVCAFLIPKIMDKIRILYITQASFQWMQNCV
jgi:hypothetical protein